MWDFYPGSAGIFEDDTIISEDSRRSPKSSEDVRSINASLLPVLFTSKIRDRKEVIVIYSFYTWFSFSTWVWANIFLEIESSKMATAHIFQSGERTWPASVSHEIEVFDPQALAPKVWELASVHCTHAVFSFLLHVHVSSMQFVESYPTPWFLYGLQYEIK